MSRRGRDCPEIREHRSLGAAIADTEASSPLWKPAMRALGAAALDLVFPRHCLICDEAVEDASAREFCASCLADAPLIDHNACRRCGAGVGPGLGLRPSCGQCPPIARFQGVAALGSYEGSWRDLVLRWKFSPSHEATCTLAWMMADRLRALALDDADLVVAAPTQWRRRLYVGRHPVTRLAEELAAALGLPMPRWTMTRRGPLRMLKNLSRRQRHLAVEGAYHTRRPRVFAGKTVLLVDDLMTSAATANAISACLLGAGARQVRLAVLARARLPIAGRGAAAVTLDPV